MDTESPWLTLYEREYRRFEVRHFQLGFADVKKSEIIRVVLWRSAPSRILCKTSWAFGL